MSTRLVHQMIKLVLALTLVLVVFNERVAAGETTIIPYEASYMGISLLNMTLTWEDQDSTIQITYDNELKPFIAYFHHLHNIYRVRFRKDSYEPLSWSKEVSEGDMQFLLEANRVTQSEVTYSNGQQRTFPDGALTVFSATHYLASKAGNPEFFPVDIKVFIDGETWNARATRYSAENSHPDMAISDAQVLIQTDLHHLEGTRVMQDNDILMNVIANEGTRFLLWVEPDGTYSKAQFGEFPKAVVLDRMR